MAAQLTVSKVYGVVEKVDCFRSRGLVLLASQKSKTQVESADACEICATCAFYNEAFWRHVCGDFLEVRKML